MMTLTTATSATPMMVMMISWADLFLEEERERPSGWRNSRPTLSLKGFEALLVISAISFFSAVPDSRLSLALGFPSISIKKIEAYCTKELLYLTFLSKHAHTHNAKHAHTPHCFHAHKHEHPHFCKHAHTHTNIKSDKVNKKLSTTFSLSLLSYWSLTREHNYKNPQNAPFSLSLSRLLSLFLLSLSLSLSLFLTFSLFLSLVFLSLPL